MCVTIERSDAKFRSYISLFRSGRFFFVTSTTVTQTLTTSTLCFKKESCAERDPSSPSGVNPKICASGCKCVPLTVTCPPSCEIAGSGTGTACPPGCVRGPGGQAIADPCDSCTLSDPLADMMIPTCPAGKKKKKRAIADSAMLPLGDLTISPTPTYPATVKR